MVTRVAIDPQTALWARRRSNLSREQAAALLKCAVDVLEKIESGEIQPTASVFRKMSDIYVLPEATLLGLSPIVDRPLPKDFRSFEGLNIGRRLSYETTIAIRRTQARQEALERLAEIDVEVVAPEIPIHSLNDDPEKLGVTFRHQLGFSVLEQLQLTTQRAFGLWRVLIENFGISVYIEPMGEDDSRGLSLFFNRFPAIVIDQAEKHYGARNFTLFHEFCHLLVRQTGISDFNPRNTVERFCNRFAASFLMPPEAVRAVFELPLRGRIEPSITQLDYSAKKLCVTISQIALRLEELEISPSGYYNRIAASLRKSAASQRAGGGGEWRYAYISRIGHNLPTLVLASLSRGNINSVEASRIMETSPDNIPAVKRTLEERRGDEGEVS